MMLTTDPDDADNYQLVAQADGTIGWIELTPEEKSDRAAAAAAAAGRQLAKMRARMVVSMFQARAALAQAGLLPQVEAAIADADQTAQIAWEYATTVRRMSPLVATIAAGLGLADQHIDDLFEAAKGITA